MMRISQRASKAPTQTIWQSWSTSDVRENASLFYKTFILEIFFLSPMLIFFGKNQHKNHKYHKNYKYHKNHKYHKNQWLIFMKKAWFLPTLIFSEFCHKIHKNSLINCRYKHFYLTPGPPCRPPDPLSYLFFASSDPLYRYRQDPCLIFAWPPAVGGDPPSPPPAPTYGSNWQLIRRSYNPHTHEGHNVPKCKGPQIKTLFRWTAWTPQAYWTLLSEREVAPVWSIS